MMTVEQSVEWELAGETEVHGENLPQCHFAHHKSHMIWTELEHGPTLWEPFLHLIFIFSLYSDQRTGWNKGLQFPTGARELSVLHNV
jgi:hypothetical protein